MKSTSSTLKKLPDAPGVYYFVAGKRVLYIGRATSLRSRVRSYFALDLAKKRSLAIAQMVEKASGVRFERSDSVLEAIIREAALIKRYQPPYNVDEKDDKSYNYLVITREDFPRVLIVRGKDLDTRFVSSQLRYVFGPFPYGTLFQEAVKIVRRIFPFRDTCTPGVGKPCFNAQLGLCPGVCSGAISKGEYGKTIRHIKLLFEGKKSALLSALKREMRLCARAQEFERAEREKRKIFALEHIQDVTLIRREVRDLPRGRTFRIEGYDVAHLGGTSTTGVMVVFENGEAKKSDYRKFKVRSAAKGDDLSALSEVLRRRFNHDEWRLPNLLVIDGGKTQLSAARRILAEYGYEIPVVSVVKDERHRPREILGDIASLREHERDILNANAEAHRFAVRYHRDLRGRMPR